MNVETLEKVVLYLMTNGHITDPITAVVSGGAGGADTLAEQFAAKNKYKMIVHSPWFQGTYNQFKQQALEQGITAPHKQMQYANQHTYYARNKLIAEDCDMLLCLMEHKSQEARGTYNTIKHALGLGKTVVVYDWETGLLHFDDFYPKWKSLELSSAGDKRFSALYARLKKFDNMTIEYIYQVHIKGYDSIKEGKDKPGLLMDYESQRKEYIKLWWAYLEENPTYLQYLCEKRKQGYVFHDKFARKNSVNQAEALTALVDAFNQSSAATTKEREEKQQS